MDFQIQVQHMGLVGERAQLTLRDSDSSFSVTVEITEWSSSQGEISTIEGRLPTIRRMTLVDDNLILQAETEVTPDEVLIQGGKARIIGDKWGGLTLGELLTLPKSLYYCARPGCGHGDRIHGEFCFAAGCECTDWIWDAQMTSKGWKAF